MLNQGNPQIGSGINGPNDNDANLLFENLSSNGSLRDIDQVDNTLSSQFIFNKSADYEKVTSARKLNSDEYEINKNLGYISLLRRLQNDEVLAVSYEYTYNGNRYKVGELTEDYQNRNESEVIFLKLLRPSSINISIPTLSLIHI